MSSTRKIIITGTGRSGTTFLVQLLTEVGLDTGYSPQRIREDYFEHCHAGLEHDLENPRSPRIVKNPDLCGRLEGILSRGIIGVEHAIIPVRPLEEVVKSRVRIGGDGTLPGGLVGTADEQEQEKVLGSLFHQLICTLTRHEIPYTTLVFPRFASDVNYAWKKLRFLCLQTSFTEFENAFRRVARPELIHSFGPADPLPNAESPAETFARHQRTKRWRRRLRRGTLIAALLCLAGGLWLSSRFIAARTQHAHPASLGN